MKKKIYSGHPDGLYKNDNFTRFMEGFKGAEQVSDDTLVPWEYSNGRTSTAVTYHIEPQGVTLRYVLLATEKTMSRKDVEIASVLLVGNPEKIGEVERIILGEAEKC